MANNLKIKNANLTLGEGAESDFARGQKDGSLAINTFGKYYLAAKSRNLFNVATTGAGVALGVDVEGTAAALVILNPASTGKDCVILGARIGRGTTGAIGPGTIFWFGLTLGEDATLPTGTALVATNGYLGAGGGAMTVLQAATVPGTDPNRIRVLCTLGENLLASVAEAIADPGHDDVDGALIIPPGAWVGISAEGDPGASPLVHISVTYQEVDA